MFTSPDLHPSIFMVCCLLLSHNKPETENHILRRVSALCSFFASFSLPAYMLFSRRAHSLHWTSSLTPLMISERSWPRVLTPSARRCRSAVWLEPHSPYEFREVLASSPHSLLPSCPGSPSPLACFLLLRPFPPSSCWHSLGGGRAGARTKAFRKRWSERAYSIYTLRFALFSPKIRFARPLYPISFVSSLPLASKLLQKIIFDILYSQITLSGS